MDNEWRVMGLDIKIILIFQYFNLYLFQWFLFLFQLHYSMSKKPQKNQPLPEIVDQQKDPMLRALQKKVRNINKKLADIAELSTKKDLKPEQEEKISKKPQVEQQKAKYLEMVEVYKEIAAESEKVIRKTQLAELEDLAAVIAAKEYAIDLGFLFNQNVDNTVRLLTTPTSPNLNLKQRIDEIHEALLFSANNLKLKKTLRDFVQQNEKKTKEASVEQTNEPEVPVKAEEKPQEPTPVQIEEKVEPVTKQVEPTPASVPIQIAVSQPAVISEAPKVETPQVEQTPSQQTPAPEPSTEGAGKEEGKGEKRGYRGYRGRGPRGEKNGDRQYDDQRDQRPYKKRSFKPKFENEEQNAQPKKRDVSSSSSSSDSEPKAREFKREEVRELIEDGFIVVGKPKAKPKARDQKEYHDKQHGRKHPKNE